MQAVDEFILELGLKESNAEKRRKITALALHEEEWTRVRLFCNILQVHFVIIILYWNANDVGLKLQHADEAQQAFSSSSTPTLQNALPALEKLYTAWERSTTKARYAPFIPALTAGMAKVNAYYERTAASDAHIMAMGKR
jgi:hypothetical protein